MPNRYREIAFTDAVRAVQAEEGSNRMNAVQMSHSGANDRLGPDEAGFLARADSFYMASVGASGWPYLQHRGGRPGFVKLLAPDRVGWAEYSGNRQYVTTGNLRGENRVSLFFMDYAGKARLKMFGHADIVGLDAPDMPALCEGLAGVRVERGMVVRLSGFDWNCPSHIPDRFTMAEVEAASRRMLDRIAALEAELAGLRG